LAINKYTQLFERRTSSHGPSPHNSLYSSVLRRCGTPPDKDS
jgi:hypothetical protein